MSKRGDEIIWCKCGSPFSQCRHKDKAPMLCTSCEKVLFPTQHHFDKARDYYCEEHCPSPEWQEDWDSGPVCARCGIERGDYWERVALKLALQLTEYTIGPPNSTATTSMNMTAPTRTS
jgi:hypothetical protein